MNIKLFILEMKRTRTTSLFYYLKKNSDITHNYIKETKYINENIFELCFIIFTLISIFLFNPSLNFFNI